MIPSRLVLSASGKVDPDEILRLAERLFGDMENWPGVPDVVSLGRGGGDTGGVARARIGGGGAARKSIASVAKGSRAATPAGNPLALH